jgi:hypothetical protein
VIKAALRRAGTPDGLPGQHHLYITFKTRAHDVAIPAELMERYPDEMTIVLQHQFWDLAPGETFFAVTLRFGGQPKRMSVPYAAVTRFYDPSVQFLLQWPSPDVEEAEIITATIPQASASRTTTPAKATTDDDDDGPDDDGPKIVSLDQFRKK